MHASILSTNIRQPCPENNAVWAAHARQLPTVQNRGKQTESIKRGSRRPARGTRRAVRLRLAGLPHEHELSWALTVELGLLERLNLADVDVLHRVDALNGLEDLPGDVLGDAGEAKNTPSRHKRE